MSANNLTWDELEIRYGAEYQQQARNLLAKADRDGLEDAIMLHAAHCAYRYWLEVGSESKRQRGAWLLAHVYAEVGDGNLAHYYASECVRITKQHQGQMKPVDLVYAEESLARANAVLDDFAAAKEHYQLAVGAAEYIDKADDKASALTILIGTAAAVAKIPLTP